MPAVQLIESAPSDLRSVIDSYFDIKPEIKPERKPEERPDQDGKYTLVLDMDETLIHYNQRNGKFKMRPGVP